MRRPLLHDAVWYKSTTEGICEGVAVRIAVCDPEAFYPLRGLVSGQLTDLRELVEVERFVRTVVLHDEISMELDPWPYDPNGEPELQKKRSELADARLLSRQAPS